MTGTEAASAARAARAAYERLLADLPHLLARLPTSHAAVAERYVALLLEANERLNLTRVVEPDAVARLHLLDSVAVIPVLDEVAPRRALDLGTGGGLPGLLLAAARPEVHWTLVDSVGKKAEAVGGFAARLGLDNVDVVAERAEVLGRSDVHRERADLVTARACAALPVLVEYALPLLAIGGALVAWKGPVTAAEVKDGSLAARLLGGAVAEVRPSGAPALGDHRFVVVRKEQPTPERYPRRPGIPRRRPLA